MTSEFDEKNNNLETKVENKPLLPKKNPRRKYYSPNKNKSLSGLNNNISNNNISNNNISNNNISNSSTSNNKPNNNRINNIRRKKPSVKVAFLGGLNEVGKNITLFECNGSAVLLDCGIAFPDETTPGVDLILPDFSYIERNIDKIKGLIITHGHEDHIGAIPYLLKKVNVPIYATKLTLAIIVSKLKEFGLVKKAKLNVIEPGKRIKLGCMSVEPIHVNHSVPSAIGVAIRSPAGILVHTGDFKIDFTPLNEPMIDLPKFAELGKEGVLALFADSTNAEKPGYTITEQRVIASFENLFNEAKNKRIIIASFASNISRLLEIIQCANNYGRKVAFSGRSMINYMNVAQELGLLNISESVIIDVDLINQYPKEKIVLITTGSQGEPMSALSRMACSDHRKIVVGPEDFIIISANPIPGNEKAIGAVINDLIKLGCCVIYESIREIHVSGHACQEELKIIQGLVKPKYFVPVHGEQRHLRNHANLARLMGMSESQIFIGDIGSLVEINENQIKQIGTVPSGRTFVDGSGVGDVGNLVLKERRHLSEDGLITVVLAVDSSGCFVSRPELFSKGFVFVKNSEPLMHEARNKVTDIINSLSSKGIREKGILKTKLKDELTRFFNKATRRKPMILPIIINVN